MFCPQAKWGDGILDLCVVGDVPKWKLPFIIPFALFGKHCLFRGITLEHAKQIEVKTSEPIWVHTDGEVVCKTDSIEISVEKKKLRFVY